MLRVTIKPSGTGTAVVELCKGPVREKVTGAGPSGLVINGERLAQERPLLRAAERLTKDRANLKTEVSFSVAREHESLQDAWVFALTHYAGLPGEGLVTFEASNSAGAVKRLYLVDATLSVTGHKADGVRTTHTYKIQGGAMSESPA
ncbi:MAG: hypothetical protein HQ559_10705 [Lentisphaerae bacterium]|nr:hypothetical protein [Lentisphaerota bacterium]